MSASAPARTGAGAGTELLRHAWRCQRRPLAVWAGATALYIALIVAVWPSLRHVKAMDQIVRAVPPALARAFGLANLTSPAGYLFSELFGLILPAILTAAAISIAVGLTAGDEDRGGLETELTLPVGRGAVWTARALATAVATALLAMTAECVLLLGGTAVHLNLSTSHLTAAVTAVGCLAALHAGVALTAAGAGAPRARALGLAWAVAVAGYLVNVLAPLVPPLAPLQRISPWGWALGSNPLAHGWNGGGLLLLAAVAVAGGAIGGAGFRRRDIRSP